LDRDQCLQDHNELKKIDDNDTRKRIVKLMNTEVKDTSQIYYNYFEDFMERLVQGKLFRHSIFQEWIKVILIAIPQAVTIAILLFIIFGNKGNP